MPIRIEVNNLQTQVAVDVPRLQQAVEAVLAAESVGDAEISLAIVDDARIQEVHRKFLAQDCATDVISFTLSDSDTLLEGELVVSAQTAARVAPRFHWSPQDELLLYAIHGTLHLVGYDDRQPEERAVMRERESHFLRQLGLPPNRHGGSELPGPESPGRGGDA